MTWPDTRILDLFGIELPIVQAPMANSTGVEVAIEVAKAGGLGALPCAVLSPKEIEAGIGTFRTHTKAPLNCNFFCHQETPDDQERDRAWLLHLAPYFAELHEDPPSLPLPRGHAPFGEEECAVLEALRPEVVSFHFGLPAAPLLARVKAAGCKIISTATSLREAVFLPSMASMRSSPKAPRPAAIAACFSRLKLPPRPARSRFSATSARASTCR
jgi:nitronate monooxygenase